MKKLLFPGHSVVWPQVCACCLEPATHLVPSEKERSTFVGIATIKRRLKVEVPYCESCHRHVHWSAGPGVIGLVLGGALISLGAAMVGAMAGFLLSALVGAPGSLATALVAACALGAAALSWTKLFPGRRLRYRPRGPLGAEHFASEPPVAIADFGKDSVTLEIHNPAYAALMARTNPAAQPS